MRDLPMSYAPTRFDSVMLFRMMSWREIKRVLSKPRVGKETYETYLSWDKERQLSAKDAGYYILGRFDGDIRSNRTFSVRSTVTLDIDFPPRDFESRIRETFKGLELFWHTSRKSSPDKPRIRIHLPLVRDLTSADEYEALSRMVASWWNIEDVDAVSFVPAQMMFFPSRSIDGVFQSGGVTGAWLDPDDVLGLHYVDCHDRAEWPRKLGEIPPETRVDKVSSPLLKPGIIGAFCRAFGITDCLESLIPGAYELTGEGRWRYAGSEGGGGALVLDDDTILYSFHTNNDPAAGRSVNAYDLVRIHKFGELDKEANEGDLSFEAAFVSPAQMPSYQAMAEFAMTFPEVVAELDHVARFEDESDEGDAETDEPEALTDEFTKAPSHGSLLGDGDPLPDEPVDRGAVSRDRVRQMIDEASNADILMDKVLPAIASLTITQAIEHDLLNAVANRYAEVTQSKITIAVLRKSVREWRDKIKGKPRDGDSGDDLPIDDLESALVDHVWRTVFAGGETLKYFAKNWWHYRNGVWSELDPSVMQGKVWTSLQALKSGSGNVSVALRTALSESSRDDRMLELTRTVLGILVGHASTDDDDPFGYLKPMDTSIVNCKNGEVVFSPDGSIILRAHDRASMQTRKAMVEYDPFAECPLWDATVLNQFSDYLDTENVVRHFEEVMGCYIQPVRDLAVFTLIKGAGGNGKSTLMKVVIALMGKAVYSESIAALSTKADVHFTSGLLDKLILLDDDYKKNAVLPDDWLKKLAEEKIITANPKYAKPFDFLNRAMPMILCNAWPHTVDQSYGLHRRAQVFEITRRIQPEAQDIRLSKRIVAGELAGVFNRLLAGYSRVLRRGGFDVPLECIEAKERWIAKSNPTARFIREFLVPDNNRYGVMLRDVYDVYTDWIGEEGQRAVSRSNFVDALADHGVGTVKHASNRTVHLIKHAVSADLALQLERAFEMPAG